MSTGAPPPQHRTHRRARSTPRAAQAPHHWPRGAAAAAQNPPQATQHGPEHTPQRPAHKPPQRSPAPDAPAHAAAATDKRLFLFWAAHAAHGPREVPQATRDKFAFIDWAARRTYPALVAYLDGLVGEMVATLTNADMWDETLMVFSSGESRRSAPCRLL